MKGKAVNHSQLANKKQKPMTEASTSAAAQSAAQLPGEVWAIVCSSLRGDARALISLARTCKTTRAAAKPTLVTLRAHYKAWVKSRPNCARSRGERKTDLRILLDAILPWAYDDGTAPEQVEFTNASSDKRKVVHKRGTQVGLTHTTTRIDPYHIGDVMLSRPLGWKMNWRKFKPLPQCESCGQELGINEGPKCHECRRHSRMVQHMFSRYFDSEDDSWDSRWDDRDKWAEDEDYYYRR